jgi:ABC-type microcin C transport system duplicated ATPase subunit YejF
LIGLLPKNESLIPSGEIFFKEKNLLHQDERAWRETRGRRIAMIFQDPFSSLNPVLTIAYQITEALKLEYPKAPLSDLRKKATNLLEQVQLGEADRILDSYPHQLSCF